MHKLVLGLVLTSLSVAPALAQNASPTVETAMPTETPMSGQPTDQTISDQIKALQKQLDALKAAQAKANPVTHGPGSLVISGTMQVWAGAATHPDTTYMKTGGFGFRLRRMEVHLDGDIDPGLSYHLNADFARGSSTQSSLGILQDIFLAYKTAPGQEVDFGQTKIPLSEIGIESSGHLPTIERPLFVLGSRNISGGVSTPQWGDIRDEGIWYKVSQKMFAGQISLTQGAGDYQNMGDNQYGKQVTAELYVYPTGKSGPQIGITGSAGAGYLFGGNNLARNRAGGSLVYKPGLWLLQGEYVAGADGIAPTTAGAYPAFTAIRHGEYGLVGYDLTPGYKHGNGYQVVAEADYWDPGRGSVSTAGATISTISRQTNYTLGINHDMDGGRRRLQVNYIHEHFDGGAGANKAKNNDDDEVVVDGIVNF